MARWDNLLSLCRHLNMPFLTRKNCTCMAVKLQPLLLKYNCHLYSNIAKQQHLHSNKDITVGLTYQVQWECKSGDASREPWISLPFIYLSDQAYCALNSYSSQNKFTYTCHSISWCNCFSWFVIISQFLASKSMTLHCSFLSCSDFLGQLYL